MPVRHGCVRLQTREKHAARSDAGGALQSVMPSSQWKGGVMQMENCQSRYGPRLRFGYLRPRPHRLAASQDCWASGHAVRIVRTVVFAAGFGHHSAFVGRPCHDLVMCGPVQGHRQNQNKQGAQQNRHHTRLTQVGEHDNTRPGEDSDPFRATVIPRHSLIKNTAQELIPCGESLSRRMLLPCRHQACRRDLSSVSIRCQCRSGISCARSCADTPYV